MTADRRFVVGTRGSPLALAQSRWVVDQLAQARPDCQFELAVIETEGDQDSRTPLVEMGGRGVFVRSVERRLLNGDVDMAVHSFKDLPTEGVEGLTIAAVPVRADARDALVTSSGMDIDDLPRAALVGTGSPRRIAQLAAYRPDLHFKAVRGNIGTRIRLMEDGEVDAVVLAVAGLARSKSSARFVPISLDVSVPAAAQGALALQCRVDDPAVRVAASIDDPNARGAAFAERELLSLLRAGCHAPVGAYSWIEKDRWQLMARVGMPDGSRSIDARVEAENWSQLAQKAFDLLLEKGVEKLFETIRKYG